MNLRKGTRLAAFDYSQPYAYYVTICVQNRLPILSSVGADPCVRPTAVTKMVEGWLLKLEDKYSGAKIISYIVMPDHIHAVLVPPEKSITSLPKMLQWFKTQTTNAYMKGVRAGLYSPFPGKLWQRGYYEHVVRNEHDLQEICTYIQKNPLRWVLKHQGNV